MSRHRQSAVDQRNRFNKIGDPFDDAAVGAWPGLPAGDPFVVYPGKDGPIDSIRWEIFAESLQDYAILQSAGIKPDDPLLADVKTYAEFPKDEAWVRKTMETILKRGDRDVTSSRSN